MICAVISDIHANAEALAVVMGSIRALAVDVVYCLGDLVGYNADPESCVRTVLSVAAATVRGNHDKAVAGLLDLDWFNPVAREAALWTRRSIPEDLLDRLRRLPQGPLRLTEGVLLCHGTPMDEDAYLYDRGSMQRSFECLDQERTYPRAPGHRKGARCSRAQDPGISPGSRDRPRRNLPHQPGLRRAAQGWQSVGIFWYIRHHEVGLPQRSCRVPGARDSAEDRHGRAASATRQPAR